MSPTIHMIVGSVTLLLFLANAVLYAVQLSRGQALEFHRPVSFAAATALLLQYALGFMLLGAGNSVRGIHWILALAAIVPVGLEHGLAARQPTARQRALYGLLSTILAVALVAVTYYLGEAD